MLCILFGILRAMKAMNNPKCKRSNSFLWVTHGIIPWIMSFTPRPFLCKIWGRSILGTVKVNNAREFSSRKSYFSSICKGFFPRNFPLYDIASSSWSSGWLDQLKRLTLSTVLLQPGWLAILPGWAGEPCKIQVSPEKSGWAGRSDIVDSLT